MSEHDHEHLRQEEVLRHLRSAVQSIEAIQKMIESQKSCLSVVQQITGVIQRVEACRSMVAQDHIASCIRTAAKPGQEAILNEMESLFNYILKSSAPTGSHH